MSCLELIFTRKKKGITCMNALPFLLLICPTSLNFAPQAGDIWPLNLQSFAHHWSRNGR